MAYIFFGGMMVLLFLLSRHITKTISHLLTRLFRSQSGAIYTLSFLFLPGVVLHELSHLFAANILFVPTGEVEFFPEIHGNSVKMGSVAVARTDPLRRFLIGVAPILGGFGGMFLAAGYLQGGVFLWKDVLLTYVLFQIGNTMFASKKDMEGALGFFVSVFVVGGVLEIVKIPVLEALVRFFATNTAQSFFYHLDFFLALAIATDIAMSVFLLGVAFATRFMDNRSD